MGVASRFAVAMALIGAVANVTAVPAVASPVWSIVPSANLAGAANGVLANVACATTTSCFAVGGSQSGSFTVPMIEHWDGTSWSTMAVPAPPINSPTGQANLTDVACPSPTTCFAVGAVSTSSSLPTALIEHWDGTAWSIVPGPASAEATGLSSVACPGANHCFAVALGSALVEEWNGATWSVATTPAEPDFSGFFGVACAVTNRCFAVGSAYVNGQSEPLVEQWDGARWSVVTGPKPPASNLYLKSVSCASASSCLAVGGGLVEQWNGASWSIVANPKFAKGAVAELQDVSCPSATDCTAVGDISAGSGQPYVSLVERWNGVSWATVPSPNADATSDFLYGVTCSSSTSCFAAGFTGGGFATAATIESWNGTSWSVVATPQVTPASGTLSAVSCATPTTCFGVGQYSTASGTKGGNGVAPLIERSGATGWSVVASPSPAGATQSQLSGVSCPSATTCFAVGYSDAPSGTKTLVERWNGKTWAIVPSPGNSRFATRLTAVSCVSPTSCFAVGRLDAQTLETLIERWNGKTWSIVPSPSRRPSPQFELEGINDLQSVSCASAVRCFAVGNDADYLLKLNETLVLQWNGSKWTIVKSPNGPGVKYSNLSSVSCPSTNSCYAVGNSSAQLGSTAPMRSLIEHWNGTAWTRVASADPKSATRSSLTGISCPSPTKCVAVGGSAAGSGAGATLVKTLSGPVWSITPSPNPAGATSATLNGVSCRSATTCFAVGTSAHSAAPSTLVERFS